ncbi:MAG: Holliday junction resolvase RuvX [Rickettsiales bacterium]
MTHPHATHDILAFAAQLPERGRLVGLDFGDTTIGIALSDGTRLIATPHSTIARRKWSDDAAALQAVLSEHAVAGIVIGYPMNMDGTPGPRAQATRAFARNVHALLAKPLPILFWDERLSTAAVTRMMIEGDLSRARRSELVDKLAASYILQGVLDGVRG